MGAYFRAVKTAETAEAVTYRCGYHYEADDSGMFTISFQTADTFSALRNERCLNESEAFSVLTKGKQMKEIVPCAGAFHVYWKILRYYAEHGHFPDAMSFQS
ncbi:MAG: hypothetical protein IK130_02215 [Oscillospiraceae bacterium]|nr:hypothetical protein [Oscillospiraceae bacterium]